MEEAVPSKMTQNWPRDSHLTNTSNSNISKKRELGNFYDSFFLFKQGSLHNFQIHLIVSSNEIC